MKKKIIKKKAGCFIVLISIMLLMPTITAITTQKEKQLDDYIYIFDDNQNADSLEIKQITERTKYVPFEEVAFAGEQNDIGYNVDAGNKIQRSTSIYAGEPVNENIPGRGRTGTLEPSGGDTEDWYRFSVCQGQSIQASITTSQGFASEIYDASGNPVGNSFTAVATGYHFFRVFAEEGSSDGDYLMSISISGQNDADTGVDAGNNIGQATPITAGTYTGYLDSTDHEDWYSFNVNSGEGIFVTVEPMIKSDYDIHLYNTNDELVHSEQFYGDDNLEYPADISGTWKIKIDIFPGWEASNWPDDYFLYGSGVYELEVSIGGSAEAPPVLKSQP